MTLPSILAIAGCVALLIGLWGGGIEAKEVKVHRITIWPRVFSSLFGFVLIGIGVWLYAVTSLPSLFMPNSSLSLATTTTSVAITQASATSSPLKTSTPPAIVTSAISTSSLGIGSKWTSPKDGVVMVYVPAGNFLMGSSDKDTLASPDEKPQHTVFLDAFWIDQTDVTNAMYSKCVNAGACKQPTNLTSYNRSSYYGDSEFDNYPVIYVSWDDATAYCTWAGRPSIAYRSSMGKGCTWHG